MVIIHTQCDTCSWLGLIHYSVRYLHHSSSEEAFILYGFEWCVYDLFLLFNVSYMYSNKPDLRISVCFRYAEAMQLESNLCQALEKKDYDKCLKMYLEAKGTAESLLKNPELVG